ncbi:hypothetical protein GUITHDRAFT_102360 [Guillardia theta CCMP2712]|uniref:Uncharacterized protein n=1 Tax=Guillardia theta (strain CCMP2712) TaxID=905079 RepID=L1JTW8_GUITC|nr:hypothetical protein GUITHDRAFT_102360 [Guillardia theta CCMP2712]EKX51754.1 hypothetical protein GUITHDRAFT_102360 [Guillardia theta CCMP2712]|eukprot:XP_005838734.1 hypothetical protein GUITHDRAFT_102360 [Guillardia theta CCMP2712]
MCSASVTLTEQDDLLNDLPRLRVTLPTTTTNIGQESVAGAAGGTLGKQESAERTYLLAIPRSSLVVTKRNENMSNDNKEGNVSSQEVKGEEQDTFIIRDTSKELFPKFPIRQSSISRILKMEPLKNASNQFADSPRPRLRPAMCNMDHKQILFQHASPLRTKFDLEGGNFDVFSSTTEKYSGYPALWNGRTSQNLSCRNAGASMLQEISGRCFDEENKFNPLKDCAVKLERSHLDGADDAFEESFLSDVVEEKEEEEGLYPKYHRSEIELIARDSIDLEKEIKQASLIASNKRSQNSFTSRKAKKKEFSIDEEDINSPWTPPETPENNYDFRSNIDIE